MEKIKVIVVDDNVIINNMIVKYLSKYEDIEILGQAYSDDEEIQLIEKKKPEIVITDLVRSGSIFKNSHLNGNNNLSGLEIIKKYKNNGSKIKFLIITGCNCKILDENIVDGLIVKPFLNETNLIQQLRKIKKENSRN